MIGDAEANHDEACATYDMYSRKLFQMAVAIAGHRFAEGVEGWANKTSQQQKFADWNLDSYERDDINLDIMARPLLPWTIDDEAAMMQTRFSAVATSEAFFPIDKMQELAGVEDPADRAKLQALMKSEAEDKAKLEAKSKPPTIAGTPKTTTTTKPTQKGGE